MAYRLVIRSHSDDNYEHEVARRPTERELEKIEDGANRNLNHEDYYTSIEEVA